MKLDEAIDYFEDDNSDLTKLDRDQIRDWLIELRSRREKFDYVQLAKVKCVFCGKRLTTVEKYFYDNVCEQCSSIISQRQAAGDDPEMIASDLKMIRYGSMLKSFLGGMFKF